jgi:hypothetical protein
MMTFQLDIVNRSRFQKGESIMKVTLVNDGDREFDITEHFQVMYDQLTGGMDWGSGFLDGNDALIVMQAGAAAGFKIDLNSAKEMIAHSSPVEKAFPIPEGGAAGDYYGLMKRRARWVKEQIGDPPTWDSIAAYRERLREMEDSE